jgi:hypothetical protein
MTTTVNTTFIQSLYTNVLQVTGTAAGIAYWQAQANAGMSAADMTEHFINSVQGQQVQSVVRLYDVFFARAPDSLGISYWVGAFNSGTSLATIANTFGGTPEFATTYAGTTNATYVEAVYTNLFGRTSDPVGKAYWVHELDTGAMTRTGVAYTFSTSPEALSSTGAPTRFTDSYLTLRAAGTVDPTTAIVKALAAANNEGALITLNTNTATSTLESTYTIDTAVTTADAIRAATANTAAAVSLATAQADPMLTIAQATQAVADAHIAVTVATAAVTVAATESADAATALTAASAVQSAAITAGNLTPGAIALAAIQVAAAANAVALATANAALAATAVAAANTELILNNNALTALLNPPGPTLTSLSDNVATSALEATYTANTVTVTNDATNTATAHAAAVTTVAHAQADPMVSIIQATQAVADANIAVTAANNAATVAATETADAATDLASANAVQTAAATASNLSPTAITLAGLQVTLANTAVALAATNAALAITDISAANAELVIANAALLAANSTHSYLYSDGGGASNTFPINGIITAGGGAGILNINSSIVAAMSMGYGGQDWNTVDTGYTTLNITNNLGAGAITLVSSVAFNDTYAGTLNLTTAITAAGAAGATTITLDGSVAGSTLHHGTATIIATNNVGAGAIDILVGDGATVVSNITTTAGEESAGGAGLTSVTMISNGAGIQNIGTTGAHATLLNTINVTQNGGGAQNVISYDTAAVSVTATMGVSATAGTQTITTNDGNDIITLIDNGAFTLSLVTINAGKGFNQISLAATHTGVDTIINNSGAWDALINSTTGVNTIGNFYGALDVIKLSAASFNANTFGAAGGIGAVAATNVALLANTTTAVNTLASSLANGVTSLAMGALVLVGSNLVGQTLDVYAVDSTATASNSIATDLASHKATLIGHVSLIGHALTAADFVMIA